MNIKKTIHPNLESKILSNCDYIIFDIETTGFSREFCEVILIGLIHYDSKLKTYTIYQLFKDHQTTEKKLLIDFFNLINHLSYQYFFTYNGHSFDIPFVNARCEKLSLDHRLNKYKHVDIYKIVRKYYKYFNLSNYKLKTVEQFLNINREDTITGKESIDLYKHYLNNPTDEILNKILLHNYEDVLNMIPLLRILDYNEIKISDWQKNEMLYPKNSDLESPLIIYHDISFFLNHFLLKNDQITIELEASYTTHLDTTYYLPNGKVTIDGSRIIIAFFGHFINLESHDIFTINLNGLDHSNSNNDDSFLSLIVDNHLIWDHLSHLCSMINEIF